MGRMFLHDNIITFLSSKKIEFNIEAAIVIRLFKRIFRFGAISIVSYIIFIIYQGIKNLIVNH